MRASFFVNLRLPPAFPPPVLLLLVLCPCPGNVELHSHHGASRYALLHIILICASFGKRGNRLLRFPNALGSAVAVVVWISVAATSRRIDKAFIMVATLFWIISFLTIRLRRMVVMWPTAATEREMERFWVCFSDQSYMYIIYNCCLFRIRQGMNPLIARAFI